MKRKVSAKWTYNLRQIKSIRMVSRKRYDLTSFAKPFFKCPFLTNKSRHYLRTPKQCPRQPNQRHSPSTTRNISRPTTVSLTRTWQAFSCFQPMKSNSLRSRRSSRPLSSWNRSARSTLTTTSTIVLEATTQTTNALSRSKRCLSTLGMLALSSWNFTLCIK